MYRTARKVHLWVGLILALVIIVEALTGLILAEPSLVGQEMSRPPQSSGLQTDPEQGKVAVMAERPNIEGAKPASDGFNIVGFAKNIHKGKVYGVDLKWLIDLTAVGLIILVVTGLLISPPMLRARHKRR